MKKFLLIFAMLLISSLIISCSQPIFEDDFKLLEETAAKLSQLEYDSLYIIEDSDTKEVKISNFLSKIEVENELYDNLKILLGKKGYDVIIKNVNSIEFTNSANTDKGVGYIYSIDGTEPSTQFLTKLEKLDKDGWYYYEDDFNEWKAQQQNK